MLKMLTISLIVILICGFTTTTNAALGSGFTTVLDHFHPNQTKVHFPYEYNVDHFRQSGPLIFFINDGLNEPTHRGLMAEIADALHGALFTTDHRFFRFNLPTQYARMDDLQYLTVEQSLADLAIFIDTVKGHMNATTNKVFVWGAGYGGALAVLARQKYPNLINGVWSTGGLFEPTVFNENYFHQLTENLRNIGGEKCVDRLQQAFQLMEELIVTQNGSTLIDLFSICRPWNVSVKEDAALLIEGVLDLIVQYIENNQRNGILNFCSSLNSIDAWPLKSLSRWLKYEYGGDVARCFNYNYEEKISWLSDTNWHMPGTSTGFRQWTYFKCTQLGQFRTLTSRSIFGFRLNEAYYMKLCKDSLGENYQFEDLFDAVSKFKLIYGGKNPGVTNALFTNGALDNYINEAITEYGEQNSLVINVDHSVKTDILESINTFDTAALFEAKMGVVYFIEQWFFD